MDHYSTVKVIGDGAYGVVYKATNVQTGEVVAIKTMRKEFTSWEECIKLREIKSLKKLMHPNIVKLKEVNRVGNTLHLIFEYGEGNLYQKIQSRSTPFTHKQICDIIYQTLLGLAYAHKNGFFHRDIKPENLLINTLSNGFYEVKICDFGQAREVRSKPPYTEYISTRWYRAPECLLRSTVYNSPIDIFAVGCIMAELYLGHPLFPGTSENDQLYKICSVLGTPTEKTWAEGLRLGGKIGYQFPNLSPTPLLSLIPTANKEAIDLITNMLAFDPQKRITAAKALSHPYFAAYSVSSSVNPALVEERDLIEEKKTVTDDFDDIADLLKSCEYPPEELKTTTDHVKKKESNEEEDLINTILAEGDMMAKKKYYPTKVIPKKETTSPTEALSSESNYSFHQKQMKINGNRGGYGYIDDPNFLNKY